ncbi:MAG: FtsX-like permease family protein [Chloroflexi bacterium]|nr:FtsX-like permease family protein [Chloroflexota bacterium]
METFRSSLGFVAQRMRANWRLLSVVGVGVLVASVLMASTTVYTRAISDLGLDFKLRQRVGDTGIVTSILPNAPVGGERPAEARAYVTDSVDARFGSLSAKRQRIGTSRAFTAVLPAFAQASNPPGVTFASIEGLEDLVTVVEGRLPRTLEVVLDPESGILRADAPIEVALPAPQLALSGLSLGETFTLLDASDECDREPPGPPGAPPPPPTPPCLPTSNVSISYQATLVGVIERIDAEAPLWLSQPAPFDGIVRLPLIGPVFTGYIADATMFESFAAVLPGQLVTTAWVDELPVSRFDVSILDDAQASFDALRSDLLSAQGLIRSRVESTLDTFETDLNFTEVPILLLLVQIVAIVLFFVVIVATILVEREETEIVLLRSRGASLRQMLGLYATEGFVIAGVAIAIGPIIASLVINALGFTPTFEAVTNGRAIDTTLEPLTWALSAGGSLFAIVAILVPVAIVSRGAASEQRKRAARPQGANVIQRYYLDIAFVVIAVGLILEADLRGSVFQRNSVGGLSSDPLVLLTPTLFALVFAIGMLRLLPLIFRVVAFTIRSYVSVPVAAALQQLMRNPGPTLRLTLLLMLGAALGTFAASYGGTVDRSFQERVSYEAGVDLRVDLGSYPDRPPQVLRETLEEVVGVESVASVYRIVATTARAGQGGTQTVQLLGLDTERAEEMLWFRDDLADSSLGDLLSSIGAPNVGQDPRLRLPNDVQEIRVWVRPSIERPDMTIWARVQDGNNRFRQVRLGSPELGGEWQQLSGETVGSLARLVPPFRLHAIFMTEVFGGTFGEPGTIQFDDIVAIDSEGVEHIVETFERPELGWWQRIEVRNDRLDEIRQLPIGDAISGEHVLEFEWSLGSAIGRRGFFAQDPVICQGGTSCRVPVIASTNFLQNRGLSIGSLATIRVRGLVIPILIRESADFFPTVDPAEGGFLIANLDHLYHISAIQDFDSVVFPNEAWFEAPADPELRQTTIETLSRRPFQFIQFVDMRQMLAEEGSDPLTAAGGSGILLVSFIAVGALIGLAFLVTIYITAQRRTVEMAVMRTLGLSGRQILTQMAVEYLTVVAIGLVVGTYLGTLITRLMLSFLEVTEFGRPVLPPFIIDTDLTVIGASYAALVVVFVLGVTGAWRFFAGLALSRVLRLSE